MLTKALNQVGIDADVLNEIDRVKGESIPF